MKWIEKITSTTNTTMNTFVPGFASRVFSHAETMPGVYPTCSDGQTPVGVSNM